MTAFAYDAGSDGSGGWPQPDADPRITLVNPLGANGLVDLGGVRIHDGTFTLEALGGFDDTPETRQAITDRAEDHGAFLSGSFYGPRTITVEGFVLVPYLDQLWPATDLLRSAFALPDRADLRLIEVLRPGWAERRRAWVRPAGPLVFGPLGGSESRKPYRAFQGVLLAPDPRVTGSTLKGTATQALAQGSGSTRDFTNAGNFGAHFVWTVNGPAESPKLIDDGRGRAIDYGGPVATGSTLVVDSKERTVLLNGANAYANVTRFDDLTIAPGASTYRALSAVTNPGGTWKVEYRDTWV